MTAADLERLRTVRKYGASGFVETLRTLLPRGAIWNIPLRLERSIFAVGIEGASVFGHALVGSMRRIEPSGIAGSGSVGALSLSSVSPFHFIDDFEDGAIKEWWNSAFKNTYSVDVFDGAKYAKGGAHDTLNLSPNSYLLRGDFTIYADLVMPEHGSFHDAGLHICDTAWALVVMMRYWDGGLFFMKEDLNDAHEIVALPPLMIQTKMVRAGGKIRGFYWTGSTWKDARTWINPSADGWTYSGDIRLKAEAGPYSGFGKIEILAESVVAI